MSKDTLSKMKIYEMLIVVSILLIMSAAFALILYAGGTTEECFESETGDIICLEVDKISIFSVAVFPRQGFYSDDQVVIGDDFRAEVVLDKFSANSMCNEIGYGKIYYETSDGTILAEWDVTQALRNKGGCIGLRNFKVTAVFTPTEVGDSRIRMLLREEAYTRNIVYEEVGYFEVIGDECDEGYCADWEFLREIDNGAHYIKECYSYSGMQPNCIENIKQTYKTVCDDGTFYSGQKTCANSEITPTPDPTPEPTPEPTPDPDFDPEPAVQPNVFVRIWNSIIEFFRRIF